MLNNDTWFMYGDASEKLNANGFYHADGGDVSKSTLDKIKAECAHPGGILCKKNTNRPICQHRINHCIKQKLKMEEKAASVESDTAMAAATNSALKDDAPSGAEGKPGKAGLESGGGDNTLVYVGAGIGVLVLGIIVVMVLKKRGGAPVAPAN